MNILTICPCCAHPMLRHIHHDRIYWFCRSCWQEMPDVSSVLSTRHQLESLLNRRSPKSNRDKTLTLV